MFQGRIHIAALAGLLFLSPYSFAKEKHESYPGEYLVKLKESASIKSVNLSALGEVKELISEQSQAYLIKRPMIEKSSFALKALKENPAVEIAEPNYVLHVVGRPNDPELERLWGLINDGQSDGKSTGRKGIDIDAERAWNIQTGKKSVIVAVIDTGVDPTLEDLAPNMWTNTAELNGEEGIDDDGNGFVDDIYGYDFANNDGDPTDDHGHGSHCSGTIGAKGNDGKGIVGVSWDVSLMGIKFLTGSGSGSLANAVKSIDYATLMKADIMSNSWGGGGFSKVMEDAIKRANDAGILFAAAAGNSTSNNDRNPHYPSSYDVDNVLAVAAIDNMGKLAYFSSYGKESVDVAAPGVEVYSTTPGGYKSWSGTSMATPHVSGVAALLLANEEGLNPTELKARIMGSTLPLGILRGKVASAGMVNAYHALTNTTAPLDPSDPFNWDKEARSVSSTHPYESDKVTTYEVTMPGAKSIAVYFSKFETERSYDNVVFKNAAGDEFGSMSGTQNDSFSPVVEGDTMIIELRSDKSVTKYGFDITGVAYR